MKIVFFGKKGGKHKSLKKNLRLTSDRKFVLLFEWIRKSRKLKIVSNEILLNQNSRKKITKIKIKICHMEIIHKDIFFINFSDIFFCLQNNFFKNKLVVISDKYTHRWIFSSWKKYHTKFEVNFLNLSKARIDSFNNSISSIWNIRNWIPAHCQKLYNTKYDSETFLLPP